MKKSFFDNIKKYWIDGWAQDDYLWKYAFANDSIWMYHFCGITRRVHENNTARNEGIKKYRNTKGRIGHLEIELKSLENLLSYYVEKKITRNIEFLRKNIEAHRLRINFLKSKNIFKWFILMFYIDCYPRKKGYILDFLVAYWYK